MEETKQGSEIFCQKYASHEYLSGEALYSYRKIISIPKEWKGKTTKLDYRKMIKIPGEWKEKSVKLEFKGKYKTAEVFVNGIFVSKNLYHYSDFYVTLDMWLQYGTENEIEIVADRPHRLDVGISVVETDEYAVTV